METTKEEKITILDDKNLKVETETESHFVCVSGKNRRGKDTVTDMISKELNEKNPKESKAYSFAFAEYLKRLLSLIYNNRWSNPPVQLSEGPEKLKICGACPPMTYHTLMETTELLIGKFDEEITFAIGLTPKELNSKMIQALMKFQKKTKECSETFTVRDALQFLGTECFRNCVSQKFWPAVTVLRNGCLDLVNAQRKEKSPKILCISFSDTRFESEIDFVEEFCKKHSCQFHTLRVERVMPHTPNDNHASETVLDNYVFDTVIQNNSSLDDLHIKVKDFIKKKMPNTIVENKSPSHNNNILNENEKGKQDTIADIIDNSVKNSIRVAIQKHFEGGVY